MSNPVRPCLGCGQYDDDPRHVWALPDGGTAPYHMACCAMARDCEVCAAQLEDVGGVQASPKGDELRQHLVRTGPGAKQTGWTAPSDAQIRKGEVS